uniref:SAM domain-containing protein n=1 Tax=Globodera pallida TaxID=36090 RepID=A0A183CMW3_GLOPA
MANSTRRGTLLSENAVRIPPVDYDDQQPSTSCGQGTKSCSSDSGQGSSAGSEDSAEGIVIISNSVSPPPSVNDGPPPITTAMFRQKPVESWDFGNVAEWLASLELHGYASAFGHISGTDLLQFDRAQYTALGVTRIAHRQTMVQSLRSFVPRED